MQKSLKNKCKKLDKRTVFVVLYELIFIFLVNALKESAKPSGTYRESAVAESRRAVVLFLVPEQDSLKQRAFCR